jgi:hypothetical protein
VGDTFTAFVSCRELPSVDPSSWGDRALDKMAFACEDLE